MMLPSSDLIKEQAYLVSRGVRPLAIVAESHGENPVAVLKAYNELCYTLQSGGITVGGQTSIIPVCYQNGEGSVKLGFAARSWIPDTLKWILENVPQPHLDRMLGLLLGYSPDAIAADGDFDSGNLFPDTVEAISSLESASS